MAVQYYEGKNWKKIAYHIKGRSAIQCLHRWTKILRPGIVKGTWSIDEDRKLIEWVKLEGPIKWSSCAEYIKGRNGKQCRERWFNTLSPNVVKGNWTDEEDYNIFYLYDKYGSKWTQIAVYFEGRTENSVKNRFYSTLRRIYNEKNKIEYNQSCDGAITTTASNELLKYLPDALMEKAVKLAKIKECSISDLPNYEQIKRHLAINKVSFNHEDHNKLNNKLSNNNEFKAPFAKKAVLNDFLSKLTTCNDSKNIGINIGNYNPVLNMSFNINTNTGNNSFTEINKPPQQPKMSFPESDIKDMSFMELEQNIMNTCSNDNFMFSDPNFNFLDNQISSYIDNFYDTVSEENQDVEMPNNNFESKFKISSNTAFTNMYDLDLYSNDQNEKQMGKFLAEEFKGNKIIKASTEQNENSQLNLCSTPKNNIIEELNKSNNHNSKSNNSNNNSNNYDNCKKILNKQHEIIKEIQNDFLNSVKDSKNESCNKASLGSLLQTLNDLESMLQKTKMEIMKFEKGVVKGDLNVDNLFKISKPS